jgi:hypothetical protein
MDTPAPAPAPATAAFDNPNPQPSQDLNFDDDFGSLRNAIRSSPDANKGETQKPKEEAPKVEKKQAEKPAEDKPKSLKDKLKVEEEPAEEESTEETTTEEGEEDDLPTYKDRKPTEKEKATWKGLKQAKAEYDKIKPEYEKLKAELEERKKMPALDDEVLKKLERLEQKEKIFDLQGSEEYQTTILAPQREIDTAIAGMSKKYGINLNDLNEAFKETVDWERDDAIEKVLKQADEEVPLSIMKNILDKAARKHEIWQKEIKMFEDADRKRAAYEHEQKQTATQKTIEEQKAWQAALDSSTQMIETQMAPLLKSLPKEKLDEFKAALKEAKISDDPVERALQAQAVQVASVLVEERNVLTKKVAQLEKTIKALSAASPASNGRQPEPKKAASDDDDDGLFQAIRSATNR